jgi:hypothetical protein
MVEVEIEVWVHTAAHGGGSGTIGTVEFAACVVAPRTSLHWLRPWDRCEVVWMWPFLMVPEGGSEVPSIVVVEQLER